MKSSVYSIIIAHNLFISSTIKFAKELSLNAQQLMYYFLAKIYRLSLIKPLLIFP